MIELKAGIEINVKPYAGAKIVHVAKNGWCKCKWPDGREFKARAHWIVQNEEYTIVATK